jgi:hypothetical protein
MEKGANFFLFFLLFIVLAVIGGFVVHRQELQRYPSLSIIYTCSC